MFVTLWLLRLKWKYETISMVIYFIFMYILNYF